MSIKVGNWPRDALPRGSELHGYRIDGILGRGGFGITYRGIDAIDQIFAIKECFPKQFAVRQGSEMFPTSEDEAEPLTDCLSRFMKEAKALKQLSTIGAAGDGVVKVSTFFQTNGTAYLVMEYLAGQSLEGAIKDSPTGLESALLGDLLPRLLYAVGCVHDAGLLHRDIKPANILFREDGRPVLIDFGAVRGMSLGHTVTYTQIYSEGYAPIEQLSGTDQGAYSDIYALGATCYRAIGGTAVDALTRHQAVIRGKRDPLIPAARIGADRYRPELLATIDAALTISPEDRPQSVAELLTLLRAEGFESPTVRRPTKPRNEPSEDHEATLIRRVSPPPLPPGELPPAAFAVASRAPSIATRKRRWGLVGALLACTLIILSVAGWTGYRIWEQRRAAEQADAAETAAREQAAVAAAAKKASVARDGAKLTEARAKSVVSAVGLGDKDFLSEAEHTMATAENELLQGAFGSASDDFAKASALIVSETREYLAQKSAVYGKQSQGKLSAGDIDGAQSALTLAKKIKLAGDTFQ